MSEHTPTPWLYRPHKHDDWGWIRGQPEEGESVGPIIATARSGKYETPEQWDEHRRNKTDPFEANAAFIVKAVNKYQSMQDVLVDMWFHFSDTTDPTLRTIADAARGLLDDVGSGKQP